MCNVCDEVDNNIQGMIMKGWPLSVVTDEWFYKPTGTVPPKWWCNNDEQNTKTMCVF